MRKTFSNPPGGKSVVTRTICAAATVVPLALTGCNQIDPLDRHYMWQATGVNQQNIAAMAVNPADLRHGHETARRRVVVESEGVQRLWDGKTLPLLSEMPGVAGSTSGSSSGGSGGSSGGASPPAGGGT